MGANDDCVICMEEAMLENFLIQCNKCSGYYHFKCINDWINIGKDYCPICKETPFFINEVVLEIENTTPSNTINTTPSNTRGNTIRASQLYNRLYNSICAFIDTLTVWSCLITLATLSLPYIILVCTKSDLKFYILCVFWEILQIVIFFNNYFYGIITYISMIITISVLQFKLI